MGNTVLDNYADDSRATSLVYDEGRKLKDHRNKNVLLPRKKPRKSSQRTRSDTPNVATSYTSVCEEQENQRPDCKTDEANLLDHYKLLHPDCIPPPMPYDEGPLRDLLDPDGISQPLDAGPPVLSVCKTCHSSLKRKKMPALSLANRTFLGPVPPGQQT
ncbi:hypothetical protein B0H13DRAFT_1857572 [Mycena leptocephala]|nr:hypothetical protein B0H13DRAFT_1857572 [Mycena leptocephala]